MKYYKINRNSAVPLYVQLSDIIRKNIDEKDLSPGSSIPSEATLMENYDISRITVRNALLRLEYSGKIFRVHGRGSFVSEEKFVDIPAPSHSWQMALQNQGHHISYDLLDFCDVWPSEGVKRELRLKADEFVKKFKRLKKIDEKVIGLDVLFIPLPIANSIDNVNDASFSMTEYLNSSPNTKIHRIEAQIRAGPIENGDADIMGVDYSNTVLIRGYVAFNKEDYPVMSGKIMYLSQYAVVKVNIDTTNDRNGNTIIEIPNL